MYLIVVDAFSKWPEVVIIDTITTSKTIDARREMFARWGLRSLYQHAPAAYIASICSAGFGSETNLHLCSAVADFNSAVPPDKALQIHSLLSASLVSQKEISSIVCSIRCWKPPPLLTKHDCLQFFTLHASSWLSVLPSQGLGLHLDAPVHQVAIKWWLGMDTSQGSQCALYPDNALDPLDIMPSLVSMGVMWHDTTPFVMFWLKHATGPILASKWRLAMTSKPIIFTPILLTFC